MAKRYSRARKMPRNYRKSFRQVGKTTKSRDKKVPAKRVGWRKSANGRYYYEARANRSDRSRKNRL